MVKEANGVAKSTTYSGAGVNMAAGPSKVNSSAPGSVKASKFKKWKAKVNRKKAEAAAAAAAASAEGVVSVGTGPGCGDASASAAISQAATVTEALTVAPVLKPATDAEGAVPAPTPAIADGSVPAPTPAIAEGSVPAPTPTIAEASASVAKPKPKPKLKPAVAVTDAAAATSKGKGLAADNSSGGGRVKSRKKGINERAMNGKGKETAEDGGAKAKAKKDVGKKEERGGSKGAGFIFMCNSQTKQECYQNRLFGLPGGKLAMVKKVRPGAKLFLYDFDLKLLYGIYKAASNGGMNLVRKAFHGKFPAQVKFKIDKDCLPLPENIFKKAIKENYNARSKFDPELNSRQVQRLIALFKPVSVLQSAPNIRLDERRHYEDQRQSYHFEERRRSLPIEGARQPWFDEERHPAVTNFPHEDPRAPHFSPLPIEPRPGQEDRIYYQPAFVASEPRRIPLALDSRHGPLALDHHPVPSVPETRHIPPAYYHTLVPSDPYYRSDRYADRAVAEITSRNPIIPRDHTLLPGEISAHTDRYRTGLVASRSAHVDELYRPEDLRSRGDHVRNAARADRMDELYRSDTYLPYETNPAYTETSQRSVSARANASVVPVSSFYPFAGGPVYR